VLLQDDDYLLQRKYEQKQDRIWTLEIRVKIYDEWIGVFLTQFTNAAFCCILGGEDQGSR